MNIPIGVCKGEICNRNECLGIIDENDDGQGCSCHINPPCSHCENHSQYCTKCGWDNLEEEAEYRKQIQSYYEKMRPIWDAENKAYAEEIERNRILVDDAYIGKIKVDRIVSYVTKSWHSGYAVKGCAPIGTTWLEIKKHFNCNYPEAMASGDIDPKTGGFTLSQFTD